MPVSGGSGIDVAGRAIAGFSSSFAISSGEYGGGASIVVVVGFFFGCCGGGPTCSSSLSEPGRRYQPR